MNKYNKTTWIDGLTELSAQNMNKLENQVEALTNEILNSQGVSDKYRHCISFTDKETNYSFSLILITTSNKKLTFKECVELTANKGYFECYGNINNSKEELIGQFRDWYVEYDEDTKSYVVLVDFTLFDNEYNIVNQMPVIHKQLRYVASDISNEQPLFANDIISSQ